MRRRLVRLSPRGPAEWADRERLIDEPARHAPKKAPFRHGRGGRGRGSGRGGGCGRRVSAAPHHGQPAADRDQLPGRLAARQLPGHGHGEHGRPAGRAGRPAGPGGRGTRDAPPPPGAPPGDGVRRVCAGAVHRHRRPRQRPCLDLSGAAATGPAEPAVAGEMEPGRHLPGAPGGRAVRAACPVADPGAGARRRRHGAELTPGDRGVRLHLAADRRRGARHRCPGQGTGCPVSGGCPDRPGRDRAGLPEPAGWPAVADHPDRGARQQTRCDRRPLHRLARHAGPDQHRHAGPDGRWAGRDVRGDHQAG